MAKPDREEFEHFVSSAEPALRRAFVSCRSLDLVPDAVSASLAWAWEHWDELAATENPMGYLFRVGQSATRQRQPLRLPPAEEISLPEVEPALVPALEKLPERQRVAVWLVHGCGWTHREAAEAMEISTSAVSTHVARGIAAVRVTMKVNTDA